MRYNNKEFGQMERALMYKVANSRLFELRNEYLSCTFSSLGASVVRVVLLRNRLSLALSPAAFWRGASDPSLAGRTVGPLCGRVRDGKASLNGRALSLLQNEGRNHLHGGLGVSDMLWETEDSPDQVRFSLDLEDGLAGYPGKRHLEALYRLQGPSLEVIYSAVSDRDTVLDLTSHLYWDLSGRFDGTAMSHLLAIQADKVVFNDSGHCPASIQPCIGAMNFLKPASPGKRLKAFPQNEQLRNGKGFNNAFILNPLKVQASGYAARLFNPLNGVRMDLSTDAPALVFYSGGFLGADTPLSGGTHASPGCALALEAQSVPDAWHLPDQDPPVLRAHARFRRFIRWTFGLGTFC